MLTKRTPMILAMLSMLVSSICLYYASLPETNAIVASLRKFIQNIILDNPYLLRYSTVLNEIKIRVLLITLLLTFQALLTIFLGNVQQKHNVRQFDIRKLRSSFALLGFILPISNLIGIIISSNLIGKLSTFKVIDFLVRKYHIQWNFYTRDFVFVELAILLVSIFVLYRIYNNFWKVLAFAIGFSIGISEIAILAEPFHNRLPITLLIWLFFSFVLTAVVGRLTRNKKKIHTIEESKPSDSLNRFKERLYQNLLNVHHILLICAIVFILLIFGLSFLSNYRAIYLALGLFLGFLALAIFSRYYPNVTLSALLVLSIEGLGIYSIFSNFPNTNTSMVSVYKSWVTVTNTSLLSRIYTVRKPDPLQFSPDGRYLAVASFQGDDLIAWDLTATELNKSQFLLLSTQPPLVNEHNFLIAATDIASNGFVVQEYVMINPDWIKNQKKKFDNIPSQIFIPNAKIVFIDLGFVTREIRIIPSLMPDDSGLVVVKLSNDIEMTGLDASTYSVKLIDLPKNAFLEAREADKMERFPYIGVETITWSTLKYTNAISFAYIPPPYNHIRIILEPFIGISSVSQLLLVLCSLVAALIVSSSTKASMSVLIGLKEILSKIMKREQSSETTETRKLVISGSGEEKDVKVRDKNKTAGKKQN